MNSRKVSERRGTVLIDREFQLRFILRLGGILLFYLLLFLVVSIVAPIAFTLLGEPPEWAMMETAFRVQVLTRIILAPLVCTFLCLFAHGILETFRVAGPNYRFKAVFRDMQRLCLPRGVRVRENDYLTETAEQFDAALVRLHDHVIKMRTVSKEALCAVRDGTNVTASVEKLDELLQQFTLVTGAPACQPIDPVAVDPVVANSEQTDRKPELTGVGS